MPAKLPAIQEQSSAQNSTDIDHNRIFLLDTNVLIHDPKSIFSFKGVVVGIPFIVLEELDKLKRESGEKGHNARESIRILDSLRQKGHLGNGILIEEKGDHSFLKIFPNPEKITIAWLKDDPFDVNKDNIIIQSAQDLKEAGKKVILVTKDFNVRIKADALGILTEDYTKGSVFYDQMYKGWVALPLPAGELKAITSKRVSTVIPSNMPLYPNQFIILESQNNAQNYRLFRHLGNNMFNEVAPITLMHAFSAKNVQQLMALDLLMDQNVQLVTLLGPAGTGKTFLALLAGLYQVSYQHLYRKLMVTRPVVALGADIGFLPGDMQEKLHYWMQPVHDNLEFIANNMLRGTEDYFHLERRKERKHKKNHNNNGNGGDENQAQQRPTHMTEHHLVEKLQQQGVLSLEAITYMRGRSIPAQFVFIDEVQNLTPHEVKTIVSRAGEGTKVILAGDPYQIDSPYLDFSSNGLTVTTEKFKDQSIFGSVFLEISERSPLAKIAAEIL